MTVEIIIIVCLIVIGVALMLAEIFLLPGITIAGIAGGVMMVGSIVLPSIMWMQLPDTLL